MQLETIVYACQRFTILNKEGERLGFFIGDGAGVGKGREVAGLILECWLTNRNKKALWFSVSSDLKVDAARDLIDIGAEDIPLYLLGKLPYVYIGTHGKQGQNIDSGVIFSTYSSLISGTSTGRNNSRKATPNNNRLEQLIQWCGKDYDGLIILDECHKAKNLVLKDGVSSSKTGLAVLRLQQELPLARVVYCSATGVSEPRYEIHYMH